MNREDIIREADAWLKMNGLVSDGQTCFLMALFAQHIAALAAEQEKKTPAWWMDGLAATLMREGVNKHRAREIAAAYWDAYCQIPGNEEEPT